MKLISAILFAALLAQPASAEVVTRSIEYTHEGVTLEGYLAYDDSVDGPRPGVLVVHEWWGLNDFARNEARRLAEQGYVAFALDMYGKGITTDDPARRVNWPARFMMMTRRWSAAAREPALKC